MPKFTRIIVSGLVQGVSFRYYTKAKADELDLVGMVRNKKDGSVIIEAAGEENNIKEFINWCKKGPKWANVKKLDVEYLEKTANYNNFEILL